MVCPYCEQGEVLVARIKKKNKSIFVCDECDTVWVKEINSQVGIGFDTFMKSEGCKASWDELEVFDE